MKRRTAFALAGAGMLLAVTMPLARAGVHGGGGGKHGIKRTLLISIDGMHALDFQNCANGISTINGGAAYCPALAALAKTGVNYINTSTSKPSDSFPGLTAIVSGASPRTTGVNYDVAYDRALNPPQNTTGNGLLGTGVKGCTSGATPVGTSTEYEEGIDIDQSYLNGGAPSGDGGVNSIDPTRLERDKNCNPVYPWNFIRTNSIFGLIHGAGGYTAWSDKHPAYASVSGPTGTSSASNLDDFFGPEINSNTANFLDPVKGAFPALIPAGCNPLPDQNTVTAGDDYTTSFQNIQCYDGVKVNAIINEIDGKNHDGTAKTQVPTLFGMNFQAVSVGQKLIYHDGKTVPAGYSIAGGYLDSIGTPSPSLLQEIEFVDTSIGRMVTELANQGLLDSTLIIVTAKHGQSPIDSSRYFRDGSNDPATLLSACIPDSELNQIGPTEDDVALLWLTPTTPCSVTSQVALLESLSPANPASANIAGIGEIFSGPGLAQYYNVGDSRAPDILITPNIGVTYSNSKKKQAEHGGFSRDDTNVILLASRPCLPSRTVYAAVETAQVAPTILKKMGYDPSALDGVKVEKTPVLPGFPKCSGDDD